MPGGASMLHSARKIRQHQIFRRVNSNYSHHWNPSMRQQCAFIFSALASSSSAFVQSPSFGSPPNRITSVSSQHNVQTVRNLALHATVAPDFNSALVPNGTPIAEGHVVSTFGGGLIAVQVDDDDIDPTGGALEIDDTTKSLPQVQKGSSLGKLDERVCAFLRLSPTHSLGDLIGRQVVFSNGEAGVVVSHRPPIIFAYTDIEDCKSVEGSVTVLDTLATVSVSEKATSVDCFGRTSNSVDDDSEKLTRPIFAAIPKVSDIALINKPLVTGVTMFDALAPIGKGQNMLMIGHDISDMRQYVCDTLSVQKDKVKCVYASTSNGASVEKMLADAGLSDDIILVSSRESKEQEKTSAAAEATLTAATACAIAESMAIEKGLDTFVVVDTIDQHKGLWDATTRVLVDVFGVDAVVKGDRDGGASSEMRAFFSSLVQRSAQFNAKNGGGSVTLLLLCTIPRMSEASEDVEYSPEDFADGPQKVQERIKMLVDRKVPLTAGNLRKIQIPIPSDLEGSRRVVLQHIDDLISMSDGQIWLDEELEVSGRRPAMDFQRSVTRIGIGADTESRADAPAMRRVVEGLRLDLSQADDMGGADVRSSASKKQIRNSLAWLLAMHQPSSSGTRKLSESVAALLAAEKGYLGDSIEEGATAGTKAGGQLMVDLLKHVNQAVPAVMESIDASGDLTNDVKAEVEGAIKSFFV